MKYRHIFWAIILITIGILFLLGNFGWIHFRWSTFWQLWPLILIFWGIAILPVKDVFKFIILVIVLAFTMLFYNRLTDTQWIFQFDDKNFSWSDDWNSDEDESYRDTYHYSTQTISVPLDSFSGKAILNLDAAAGSFLVEGKTSDLLFFNKKGDIGDYSLTTEDKEGKKEIFLHMEKTKRIRHIKKNKVDIKLNPNMVWNIDFSIGAASMDMDLAEYKVDTVTIEAGASSIEMKLGVLNPQTVVIFSSGASSLSIRIPKESACEIQSESILVSRDFEGFDKKGGGIYRTLNFPEGKNQIIINIESAVSSLKVDRY